MVKTLHWDVQEGSAAPFPIPARATGDIDGLKLFEVTKPDGYASFYEVRTTLPVTQGRSFAGSSRTWVTALEEISTLTAGQEKAQQLLQTFTDTLGAGEITWSSGNLVKPFVGAVGGINLFRILALGKISLATRLPLAPGGVAQGDLESVQAAKVKAQQALDQFVQHLGIRLQAKE